jgi:hypothetical protein
MVKDKAWVPTYDKTEIDSETLHGVTYEVIDGHIVVRAGVCGKLSVRLENVEEFCNELADIAEVWR